MKNKVSFKRRVIQITVFVILPILICLIAFDVFIMDTIVRTNVTNNYKEQLDSIGQNVVSRLMAVERYMLSFVATGTDFNVLSFPADEVELFQSTQRILERYRYIMYTDEQIGGFLVLSPVNDYYRIIQNQNMHYISSAAMLAYLEDGLEARSLQMSGWFLGSVDGTRYLMRIMGLQGAYQMCFINADELLLSLGTASGDETFDFAEGAGSQSYQMSWEDGRRTIKLYYHNEILFAPLEMTAEYRIEVLPIYWVFIALTVVTLLAFIPAGAITFSRLLLQPLEHLSQTLSHIKDGNLEAKLAYDGSIAEYRQMSLTFNEMMEQISDLKIQSYEQQIEALDVELQYLHLQIRPHFYLNCLKILYGLAEMGDYARIQEIILLLSNYLRAIWSNTISVPVRQEMQYVATFIALNNIIGRQTIDYNENLDERLNEFPLPPLILLTFVENAVKHAQQSDRRLCIAVSVQLTEREGRSYVHIGISDNGPGFPGRMLQMLNKRRTKKEDVMQLGIRNIKERLRLSYHGEASIAFTSEAGASVDIQIPFDEER